MKKLISTAGAFIVIFCAVSAWAGSFTATSPMITSKDRNTATLLPNGKVLIAGGFGYVGVPGGSALNVAEVYDPATGTFAAAAGNMTSARMYHTATLLPNGKVLITGGCLWGSPSDAVLSTAELYDPATGTFTATAGNMTSGRMRHTATLLANGTVLIAGGATNTAEVYDPASNTFTATAGNMHSAAYHRTATLLPNDKVLLAGGYYSVAGGNVYLNTAEVYDTSTGNFAATTGIMISARGFHTATLLPNGMVLIAGGEDVNGYLNTAEVFDPASGAFTATAGNMASTRYGHIATLLPNGTVLIAGGYNGNYLNLAEVYNPAFGTFAALGNMTQARFLHSATLLPNGSVLIVGGWANSAEVYDSEVGAFTATTGNLTSTRIDRIATLLPDGKVLIAGGYNGSFLNTAEVYDPVFKTFSATAGDMSEARAAATATLLMDGKVLITGGWGNSYYGTLNTSEVYDPATGIFTPTSNMNRTRGYHTATLLQDGKVLITGGSGYSGSTLNFAEVYDPATGTFTPTTGIMNSPRESHTATLLPDGKVLLVGGWGELNTAELYDPSTGTFIATAGTMSSAKYRHTATLLPNGTVLIAGGYYFGTSGNVFLNIAEIYDHVTGFFTSTTGNMTSGRCGHTATLLQNGKVLIAGGNDTSSSLNTAEMYDPATSSFTSSAGNMVAARTSHTSTLLPDGRVLIAGGWIVSDYLNTAEVYDPGLGFSDAWRPVVAPIAAPIIKGQSLSVTGSGFKGHGNAEGSGGATNNSASNFPLAMLRSIDSGQTLWLQTAATTTGFTATSLATMPVDNFPAGPSVLTVFVNGIPSLSAYVSVVAEKTYTVIPSARANGTISPANPQTIDYNQLTTFTITPDIGYHIALVTGCSGTLDGNTYSTGQITADCTVSATFAMNMYTVTPSAGENGTISPAIPQTVNYNQLASFTIIPDIGYHIAIVSGCSGSLIGNRYDAAPIKADCTVSAAFAVNTYTVTPSAGANGTVSPSPPQTVNYNQPTAFLIAPNIGYRVDTVTGCNGTLLGNTYSTGPITADCTVIATFVVNTYSLTVAYTGTGSGTVTSLPSGINCGGTCLASFISGTSVTLNASPGADSIFAGWNGGDCSGTGACVTTMDASKTVTAAFNQAIMVTTPNGGESWNRGSTYTIQWNYAGNLGASVRIELLKGGVVNRTITSSTSRGTDGSGSYNWRISRSQATGSNYSIRITSTSKSNYKDLSDSNFTIR